MKHRMLKLSAAALAAGLLCAYTATGGLIDWQYFGTPNKTGGMAYDGNGLPTILQYTQDMPKALPPLPADLQTRLAFLLPEGKDIRTNSQGLVPDSDDKTNISFTSDADVYVTFITEGAGYRNSVGYFVYDAKNPPTKVSDVTTEQVLFTNASIGGGGGAMDVAGTRHQNTVHLPTLKAGQALGFFIAANGYSDTGRVVNGKRTNGVLDSQSPKWIFYTLRNLNPEASSSKNLNVHTIMLKDLSDASASYQRIVLGFEDINRESGGDHDFNDVVLAVHVTPQTAIDPEKLKALAPLVSASDPDTDGDGVKDSLDEFPTDATKAFSQYYPDANTWGTLAFEDQWPMHGDYDMNDVLMRYRSRQIMNSSRQVVALTLDYRLDARGGTIPSGFGINLPGIAASSISSATLSTNGGAAVPVTVEAGQTEATFIVTPNVQLQMPVGSNANCAFANTQTACPSIAPVPFHLELTFKSGQDASKFSAPFNPFIFQTGVRGQELHLPGKTPTALASAALFGTQDDRTVVGTSNTYMDAERRPWALDIPGNFAWPLEKTDLLAAYPRFATWATSGGASAADWYLSGTVPANTYTPK